MCRKIFFGLMMSLALNSVALEIVINKGQEGAQPIIIVPFGHENTKAEVNMASVIRGDLALSGRFKPLAPNLFSTNPNVSENIDFANWQNLGAAFMAVGKILKTQGEVKLQVDLVDIYGQQRVARYSNILPKVDAKTIRKVGHKISDLIYQKLTDKKGAFSTRLAYVSVKRTSSGQKSYALEIAGVDGKDAMVVFNSTKSIFSPTWSPDGKNLSFVSLENDKTQVWRLDLRNRKRTKVADFLGNNSAPAWSPDGSSLAVSLSKDGNPEIYIISLNGALRRVSHHAAADTEPVWSPDGNRLYFLSDRGGSPQIYQKSLLGEGVRKISIFGNYNASPDISADGKQMALLHKTALGYQIAVQNLSDETLQVVSNTSADESPSFAPNGQMLVYATNKSGRGVLTITDLTGTVHTVYSSKVKDIREPTWSPYLD